MHSVLHHLTILLRVLTEIDSYRPTVAIQPAVRRLDSLDVTPNKTKALLMCSIDAAWTAPLQLLQGDVENCGPCK